ncbi:hypothetical protein J422_01106 [Methanocaldococcus villosus KIN24-T80]|uniref:Uncharacterized protein n=1 Tax=Methanocaldococcus villosus KIN24-T80 TaxID=1069083 RepID=N6UWF3_9EURY|nr:hypothetical protein [Methanocaldococcus villosus]ENN96649.1 hypothetical protein J422_01106 [Methanocaldococcus villosus KIN24-T80]
MDVAYKIYPEEFLNNEVVDNCLILNNRKLKKIRVMGRVDIVGEGECYLEGVLIKGNLEGVKEGDIIDVIGYPRNKFIEAEIIKRRDEKWLNLRKLEIELTRKYIEFAEPFIEDKEELKRKIIEIINKLESVKFDELKDMLPISEEELEEIINELIEIGEIFEPRPRVYKTL